MKANTVASGRPSDPTTPEGNDAETGLRRSLGLGPASDLDAGALSSNDPIKAARQVIRSQAARDYAERELVHAEATIQELRTRLHHAHREKDAALEAARLATAAKLAAQRSMLEAEAARDCSDRTLRGALATNRDLQAKLDAFARGFVTARAEPAAERQARLKANDSQREAPTVTARRRFLLPATMTRSFKRSGDRSEGHARRRRRRPPRHRTKPAGRPWMLMRPSPGRQATSKRRPEADRPPDKNLFSGGLRAGTGGDHRRPVWGTP
jgi:hypothetical protein